MDDAQKLNLYTHITNMGHSLAQQVTGNGSVLVRAKNSIQVDLPSMHHIAEFVRRLDGRMFEHYLHLITKWLSDPDNGAIDNQFTIDTISGLAPDAPVVNDIIEQSILPTQIGSGAFTKYTAFLHGGDFFSTLWCIKILQNVNSAEHKDAYQRALQYIVANCRDSQLKTSLKGFAYMLLLRDGNPINADLIESLKLELHAYVQAHNECTDDLLWQFYIYEDLLEDPEDGDGRSLVEERINQYFELDKEATSLPLVFEKYAKETGHQCVTYHLYARACIVALLLLDAPERQVAAYTVNRFVQSRGLEAVYVALEKDVELKEYLQKYGNIHEAFAQYENDLEKAWNRHLSFDRSVFIMMPFKKTLTYRSVALAINEACDNKGFKAIRVDDEDRHFRDTLWDNLVVNMLSCKYAVAVYVSEQLVDRLDNNEPKMFPNPNVALEYGFFRSRGQSICLLKDRISPIPSDLQGFIWNEFSIDDPHRDIVTSVEDFLDDILNKEEEQGSND